MKKKKHRKRRNPVAEEMIKRTGNHAGPHHNREYDVKKGRERNRKHKKAPVTPGALI